MAEKGKFSRNFLPFVIGLIVFIGIVGGGFFYLKNRTQNLKSFKINNIAYKRIYTLGEKLSYQPPVDIS